MIAISIVVGRWVTSAVVNVGTCMCVCVCGGGGGGGRGGRKGWWVCGGCTVYLLPTTPAEDYTAPTPHRCGNQALCPQPSYSHYLPPTPPPPRIWQMEDNRATTTRHGPHSTPRQAGQAVSWLRSRTTPLPITAISLGAVMFYLHPPAPANTAA